MDKILIVFLIPTLLFAWDFTQERNTIPVEFNGVECQVPWTTGYSYINPTFCDLDGDNDYDLICGSDWNRQTLVRNDGDEFSWYFTFVSDNFIELNHPDPSSQITCRPAFCDVDNDSDFDLVFGGYDRLFFFRNEGNSQNYTFVLEEEDFQGIDFNTEYYPVFVDIDSDSDSDFFLGYGSLYTTYDGEISFYENIGTPDSMVLTLIEEEFMNIDLGDECIPAFCDIDNDGDYDMFLGDEDGLIHYYRNDGTPEVYDFTFMTDNYADVNVGNIASPAFCDIDGDGDFDLFVGERSWGEDNRHGDINFYENIGTPGLAVFELVTQNLLTLDVGPRAASVFADINADGLTDMFLGETDGNINYFANIGSMSEPRFALAEEVFNGVMATYQSRPDFGDMDGDGDLDLLVGRVYYMNGSIRFYRNDGTPEVPDYTLITSEFLGIECERPTPRLIDIDNDADLDFFVGHSDNQVIYWENAGTPTDPRYEFVTDNYFNTPLIINNQFHLCFGDIDGDNDYDMLREDEDQYITFYRNIGTPELPDFIMEENNFLDIEMVHSAEPYLEDIDADSDLDLFVGDFCGGVSFWRNNEISAAADIPQLTPYDFSLGQNYPNPFNPSTNLVFSLKTGMKIEMNAYDIQGRLCGRLAEGFYPQGEHTVSWNAAGLSSGIYFCKLAAGGYAKTVKALLVK